MKILVSEEAGVRYLHFGSGWIQGAMRIARPWSLELEYTQEMMACLLLRPEADWPRRVLLVGLGTASLLKFIYRHCPHAHITVVEIEPSVVATARQYFKLPDDGDRVRVVIGDGADYMVVSKQRFDLIMVDGYDAAGGNGRLGLLPFLLDCKSRLSEQGILVSNLLSKRKRFHDTVGSLNEAFTGRSLVLPPSSAGNVVAFNAVGPEIETSLAQLRTEARALKARTGLNILPMLARLESAPNCRGGIVRL